jgi:cell division protein FtsW (lipid II flippase)
MSSVLPPLRGRPVDLTSTFAAFRLEPGTELPPYRNRELRLLVGAGVLATAALAALTISRSGTVKPAVFSYGLLFSLLWVLAHLAVRRFAPAADPVMLPVAAALNGIGLVIIYRIDLAREDRARQNHTAIPPSAAERQLVWTLIALIVFVLVLALIRDHKALSRYTYTAGLAGLVCLMLPVLPIIGRTVNGSRIWVAVGPIGFQPSEVAKIILMVFFAGYLVEKREVLSVVSRSFMGLRLPRARDLGPVLVAWAASLGVLIFETDLGSSLLFFGMFLVILYIATERVSWVVIGLTLFLFGAFITYHLFGHVQVRVDAWLHAFDGKNPLGASYQLTQGLFDFGQGGITGTGLGRGTSNLWRFNAANSDFVMTTIGLELGLTGLMALLVMYGLVVMRGIRAAIGAKDAFGKLLATGLSASLALQVFVQVGGVMRLIPLTGLTLPFISAGGSSIVANAAIIALLLRISDAYRRPAPRAATGPLFDPNAVADSPTTVVQTG